MKSNAQSALQGVVGQPVSSSTNTYDLYGDSGTWDTSSNGLTSGLTPITTGWQYITTSTTTNYTTVAFLDPGPKMYRWGGQVFLEPSEKLRKLFTALQLM